MTPLALQPPREAFCYSEPRTTGGRELQRWFLLLTLRLGATHLQGVSCPWLLRPWQRKRLMLLDQAPGSPGILSVLPRRTASEVVLHPLLQRPAGSSPSWQ